MKIAGLIFDFDGTLATPSTLDFTIMNEQLAQMAAKHGFNWPQEGYVLERVNKFTAHAWAKFGARRGRGLADEMHAFITGQEVAAAEASQLLPFTTKVLQQAQALGLRLAIVSRNCSPAILAVYAQAHNHVFLPRDHTPWVKPDPRHYLRAAQLMQVPISACAAMGDHVMDMEAADAAGCLAIGVLSGLSDAETLYAAGARMVLKDISQVLPWLDGQGLL